ncbi:tail protein [Xanthomonas phage FoX4]|uniref:Tail protein n=1 Tax=Xanthomonas phage FoX4 TaxID=2723900 RepID=A0A858WLY4_9CAUD|nr:tail protein [Xanthomonas phage FoX4]QJI52987.1 tail protein [Xanthomonas phage FoX4]
MGFVAAIVVALVAVIVGELLRPIPKLTNAKASSLDDFDLPTAEEGRAIPIFFGKVKVTGPNIVWYGNLRVVPIKKKVKVSLFKKKTQIVGYKYYIGMQVAISHYMEGGITLHNVLWDDEEPSHRITATTPQGVSTWVFNDNDFFGGDEAGGGISGAMLFYQGSSGQPSNQYLNTQLKETAPPYEGLCHAVLQGMYVGTSSYLKTMSLVLSCYPNRLLIPDGKHRKGDDCNPTAIIYELVVDNVWGCSIPSARIDVEQWRQIALKLWDEGFMISSIYNGGTTAKEIIAEILRHIDGVMFTDPDTGLVVLKLARDDYDRDTIQVFDASVFLEGIKFSRSSWSETKNHIKASYIDRADNFKRVTIAQADLANVMQRGGEMSYESVDYTGFNSYEPAAKALARTLKTLSYPLSKVDGPILMTGTRPKPNDVFMLRWPDMGIDSQIYRIVGVDYSSIGENKFGISAVEDIFSISESAYTEPDPGSWVNPIAPPVSLINAAVFEQPYFLNPGGQSNLMSFASRSGDLDYGYATALGSSPTDLVAAGTVQDFTSTATLTTALPQVGPAIVPSVGIGNVNGVDEIDRDIDEDDRLGGYTLAVIKGAQEELIAYSGIDPDTGTLTGVMRGVLDTVPQSHEAGAKIYLTETGYGEPNPTPYVSAQTVYAKLMPYNGRGSQPVEEASLLSTPVVLRSARPLPPGKIRVDGFRPTEAPHVDGRGFVVSWAHRSRLDETLASQDDDPRVPEPGTTYTVRALYGNELLVEKTGIANTAAGATITLVETREATIEIFSVLNDLASFQIQRFTVTVGTAGPVNAITGAEAEYVIDGGGA